MSVFGFSRKQIIEENLASNEIYFVTLYRQIEHYILSKWTQLVLYKTTSCSLRLRLSAIRGEKNRVISFWVVTYYYIYYETNITSNNSFGRDDAAHNESSGK